MLVSVTLQVTAPSSVSPVVLAATIQAAVDSLGGRYIPDNHDRDNARPLGVCVVTDVNLGAAKQPPFLGRQ